MTPSLPSFRRAAALVNAGLVIAFVALWLSLALKGAFWRADFRAFYTGWTIVLDGDGGRLYDLEVQDRHQRRVLPELPADEGLLPFVHPPHAAVAMSGLALLPRDLAFYLWTALGVLLCIVGGRLVLRLLSGPQQRTERRLVLLTIAAFPPLFMSFQLGQVTLLCVVCVLGFVVALKEDRPLAMAVWIMLGTVKPQLMVVPILALLALRQWRALAWLATLGLGAAAVTTLALGPACWTDYLAVLRFCTQQFATSGIDPAGMYNLKGALTTTLGADRGDLINLLTKAAWLAGLVGVLALLWPVRDRWQEDSFDARLALALLLGLLTNPHVNPTDVLAFVPPAVLFRASLTRTKVPSPGMAFDQAALVAPLLFVVDYYLLGPLLPLRPFVMLGLGLCTWMALTIFRGRGRTTGSSPLIPVVRAVPART